MTEGQILYGLAQVDTVSLSLYLARTCSLQSYVISAVHTLPEVHRIYILGCILAVRSTMCRLWTTSWYERPVVYSLTNILWRS